MCLNVDVFECFWQVKKDITCIDTNDGQEVGWVKKIVIEIKIQTVTRI